MQYIECKLKAPSANNNLLDCLLLLLIATGSFQLALYFLIVLLSAQSLESDTVYAQQNSVGCNIIYVGNRDRHQYWNRWLPSVARAEENHGDPSFQENNDLGGGLESAWSDAVWHGMQHRT